MDVTWVKNNHLLDFMHRETMSPFECVQIDSTVPKEYCAGSEFDIKYLEIPVEDLCVFDSRLGTPSMREHIYADKDEKLFRFFIHPESEELYKGLIAKYGVAGTYNAKATSSVRTLLARNSKLQDSEPVFLKLSLNRRRSGVGRVVSDWEIRRSILVSHLTSLIPSEYSEKYGVSVIPDFAGAYIGKDVGTGAYIDEKQYTIFQHGLIFRDTQFMKRFPKHQYYPLFALFAERSGKEPLIVEWWREECGKRCIGFEQFLSERVVKPLVRAIGYLVFEQGIIPDTHGQNLVVAVNSNSQCIEHIFNRDVGSMKVNFLLRWVKGWEIEMLKTHNIAYDFKFGKACEIAGKPFFHWILHRIFGNRFGTEEILKAHVPNYSIIKMQEIIQVHVANALDEHLPGKAPANPKNLNSKIVQHRVERYIRTHKPKFIFKQCKTDRAIFNRQCKLSQSIELPNAWLEDRKIFNTGTLHTEYGIIYPNVAGKIYLAFLPLDSGLPNKPTHYQIEVPINRLFIDRGLLVNIYSEPEKKVAGGQVRKPIPVIKAGSETKPAYHVIAGNTRVKQALKRGCKKIQVKIINDITGLPSSIQKNILSQAYLGSSLLK